MSKIISNGEWISCPLGHRQFQALRDIHSGEQIRSADFVLESGIHPETGSQFGRCGECGATYMMDIATESGIKRRPHLECSGWVQP